MATQTKVSVSGRLVSGADAVELAQNACVEAKRFEKIGEYQSAYEVLAEYWPDRQAFPVLPDLPDEVAAELLLRIGALACWLGSSSQIKGNQELGKDIISRALELLDGLDLAAKVAEARGDLGLCYWREGAFDEARIQYSTALKVAPTDETDLRAVLLIRAGIVEVDAHRLNNALSLYSEALPLVELSKDETLKGSFHFSFGVLFQGLSLPENREDYLDKSLVEYSAASFHFEQAGNVRAQARVENNLGNLFCVIGRYQEAHRYLDRARRLFAELGDDATIAVVDETRARTLLGEGRLVEAEDMIRMAVKALEKGDEQAVLTDALITYGVVTARLGFHARAKVLLERAIDVAETMGELADAGRAKLSIVEELRDKLSIKELVGTYRSASERLRGSQDPYTSQRLISCADALFEMMSAAETGGTELQDTWEGFSFKAHVKESERSVIERALRDAGGSVTKAAKLLGFKHHQSLIGIIKSRHPELLKVRSTVRKRRKMLIDHSPRKNSQAHGGTGELHGRVSLVHVGDHRTLARVVSETSASHGAHVDSFTTADAALKQLSVEGRCDLVVIDNALPGGSGLGLVFRIRALSNRKSVPILLIGDAESETEAWRARVNAFLPKENMGELASAIDRLLNEKQDASTNH